VKTTYCLDACALIAYIKNEEGADIVESLFDRASADEVLIYISAINLSEVIYNFRKEKSDTEMDMLWQNIRAMPVAIIHEISDHIIIEAARLKSHNKMSHADALGLATAGDLGAAFVTSDHDELESVEQHEPISFLWLPAKPKK
jgi:predicted nucleic acid-binding protein